MKTLITSVFLFFYRLPGRTERNPISIMVQPADATVADQPYVGYKDDPEWLKTLIRFENRS